MSERGKLSHSPEENNETKNENCKKTLVVFLRNICYQSPALFPLHRKDLPQHQLTSKSGPAQGGFGIAGLGERQNCRQQENICLFFPPWPFKRVSKPRLPSSMIPPNTWHPGAGSGPVPEVMIHSECTSEQGTQLTTLPVNKESFLMKIHCFLSF